MKNDIPVRLYLTPAQIDELIHLCARAVTKEDEIILKLKEQHPSVWIDERIRDRTRYKDFVKFIWTDLLRAKK